ncbi:ISP domain-containing protein [Ophiobolus disseminans]|uniref:Choline monooxygenase, chloroplastic n=1 Tax=Ophiobolus disseminans TaxID=1469910 RepID=A0A6A6ZIW5_9PLEO|nr:ISP domain-containing protein [Ophiobolus disseminans]
MTKPAEDATTATRGLPSSWYRSDALYQLERRAIFSKRWILVSHKNRFGVSGDFVQFEEAGFRFFLCRDRTGRINGFHNVCRHRAFPVVTERQGRARIISCRYHGWSYGLDGNLAKAPGYNEMKGFERQQNGLFPINVHVDAKGFIWVNMDAENEVPWGADFKGVDKQARFDSFNFDDYRFDHIWEMSGDYNWKTLADNYNECYHCPTAHPDAAALADLTLYAVDTNGGHIQHYANLKQAFENSGLKICSTFYFPNACMTVSPNFFYMMRCVPTSAHHCSMEYEVYRHKDATDESFEEIDAMFKRILSEDKWLCNNAQENLEAGVFVSGEMHSRMEKGPLFFQDTVRKLVKSHHEREAKLQREIWPARQRLPELAKGIAEDEQFCAALACNTDMSTGLEW